MKLCACSSMPLRWRSYAVAVLGQAWPFAAALLTLGGACLQGNWWVFMLTFLLTLTIGVVVSLRAQICACSSVCKQESTAWTCLLTRAGLKCPRIFLVFSHDIVQPCALQVAYFIAAVSPNMEIANTALPAYIVTLLFFIGFLPRWTAIHWYWRWCAACLHTFGNAADWSARLANSSFGASSSQPARCTCLSVVLSSITLLVAG